MATIGDPLLDLAWVLMGWPNADEDRTRRGYVDYDGMPTATSCSSTTRRTADAPVDEIDYYVILGQLQDGDRARGRLRAHDQRRSDNPKAASFGDYVMQSATKAGNIARSTPLRNH